MTSSTPTHKVELPGGGEIALQTQEEVDLWNESAKRYIDDYQLTQQNDLNLLGSLLAQQLIAFRASQALAGMEPEFDARGLPTGYYIKSPNAAKLAAGAQKTLILASDQIRAIEVTLGIDKKTREAGGQHTVQNYVSTLKAAGREYGLRIQQRVMEYERILMDARQRLRILYNADDEDRQYHNITPDTICAWLFDELGMIEEDDKRHARDKMRIYVGKI